MAVEPAQSLDVSGPADVFTTANLLTKRDHYCVELVSGGSTRRVATNSGIELKAHKHYKEVRGPIDTFLITGGTGARTCADGALIRWIARTAPRARRFGSVCTGTFLLAEAGLLAGRHVSTHWVWAEDLASRHPKTHVDAKPIWIQDQHLFTSAGVTAGIDLSLALVEQDLGPSVAQSIARYLVLYLRRPGGQAQFSTLLAGQDVSPGSLKDMATWILEHLALDLCVENLAARAAMSPRNFSRQFMEEFGQSPARYVEQVRLETAKGALHLGNKSVEEIADACGFGSAEAMRRSFKRRLGVSPAGHRKQTIK